MDAHSEFVFYRTYSKWREDLGRMERWEDTCDRYTAFLESTPKAHLVPKKVFRKIREFMLSMGVVGSMRLLWSAGKAAKASNVAAYNCSFLAIDCATAFSELVYISMCGCGVGASIENKYISKLPAVQHKTDMKTLIVIPDSKEGWADSIKQLLSHLYIGHDVEFDYSLLRERGTPLSTMGGTSSGRDPLVEAHQFIRNIFRGAQGRKLYDIEVGDIICSLLSMVVCGGVRRSSGILITDRDSDRMCNAKVGFNFPEVRYMANNSWIAREKPDVITFMEEWLALAKAGTGERGIINLTNVTPEVDGTNPCSEILLRSMQFCNLSEVIIRTTDDIDSLLHKVETATWIGMIQSTLLDFPYLRPEWKQNCIKDNLLGVSITGQMDNMRLLTDDNLVALRKKAWSTAKKAAKILDVNVPARITCGKPSGTVSQVMNCGSGMHVWWAKHMIRRYRIESTHPLLPILREAGVKLVPDVACRNQEDPRVLVVEFPVKAPEGSITKKDVSVWDQLNHYETLMKTYVDHNQSATIYVPKDLWMEVGSWVYSHWDSITGLSFLPDDGGTYELAPLEEITEDEYNKLVDSFPKIDYTKYKALDSQSEGAKTFACTGDKCALT